MSNTLLPFLYQTRTLLRLSRVPTRQFARTVGTFQPRTKLSEKGQGHDIPFDDTTFDGLESTYGGALTAKHKAKKSSIQESPAGTLTPDERRRFESIFADIEARGKRPVMPMSEPDEEDIDIVDSGISVKGQNTIQMILEDAGDNLNTTGFEPLSPIQQLLGENNDRGKLIMRYPQPLRMAAHKALGFLDAEDHAVAEMKQENDDSITAEKERAEAIQRRIEIEAERRPERQRVEHLMKKAHSDFELWQVLEKEVFTMVDKLGLNDSVDSTASTKFKTQPTPKLSLRIHGPNYPSHLLFALRLLDTKFARPSPLALSVLPRVRQLGLMSYVLGISTPFYNQLMAIYWNRYGDVNAILTLLSEMQTAGLYMDEGTLELLELIRVRLRSFADGTRGGFARELMLMPEYEASVRGRLGKFIHITHLAIQERQATLGF